MPVSQLSQEYFRYLKLVDKNLGTLGESKFLPVLKEGHKSTRCPKIFKNFLLPLQSQK